MVLNAEIACVELRIALNVCIDRDLSLFIVIDIGSRYRKISVRVLVGRRLQRQD